MRWRTLALWSLVLTATMATPIAGQETHFLTGLSRQLCVEYFCSLLETEARSSGGYFRPPLPKLLIPCITSLQAQMT